MRSYLSYEYLFGFFLVLEWQRKALKNQAQEIPEELENLGRTKTWSPHWKLLQPVNLPFQLLHPGFLYLEQQKQKRIEERERKKREKDKKKEESVKRKGNKAAGKGNKAAGKGKENKDKFKDVQVIRVLLLMTTVSFALDHLLLTTLSLVLVTLVALVANLNYLLGSGLRVMERMMEVFALYVAETNPKALAQK